MLSAVKLQNGNGATVLHSCCHHHAEGTRAFTLFHWLSECHTNK